MKFSNRISANFGIIKPYLLFNLFLCAFGFLYYLIEIYWGDIYDFVFFYFDSPYKDFVLWFPRHHFWIYTVVIIIKAIVFLALIAGIIVLIRQFHPLNSWLNYNKHEGYLRFVALEYVILLFALSFYIALYFSSVVFLSPDFHRKIQLVISKGFLLHLSFQVIVTCLGNFRKIWSYLQKYLLQPSLPYNIAVLRILFFLYLAFIYLTKHYSALPMVSLESKVALPYIGWLIDIIPVNPTLYTFFVYTGIICCLFIVIGFKARFFLLINAICCFYIMATPNFFGKLWHEQLVIWIAWFFTFSRCFDALSLDAKFNKVAVMKSPDYTFPVRFIWLQLGIIYFWAGFYKLWDCGFDWALSDSMINQVQLEWLQNYDKVPGIRIDKYPVLLHVGGLLVILFELSYPLLILKPSIRWMAAGAGLLMHNIIGYFMYIAFLQFLQVFYIFYFDFTMFFRRKIIAFSTINTYSKSAFVFGIVILSMNFLCGIFSIDTYPFSAYPKYAALIPDKIKIIHFEALSDGNRIDIHNVGKKNNFRWESYGWLEDNLIRDFENGVDVSTRLNDYWKIWQAFNPELQKCKEVKVYIKQRPVNPEGINQYQIIQFMGIVE